jgi:pre-rRNA-processing protein TSR4
MRDISKPKSLHWQWKLRLWPWPRHFQHSAATSIMPSYDSDSSDDGQDYSITNVTLGYASTESTGDEISQIGGHPTWLDPAVKPSALLAKCKICNNYMSQLLQLNADLQSFFPQDERRLHIFTCRKKQCTKKIGSVRAFREVRKAHVRERKEKKPVVEEKTAPKPVQDLGSALFGSSGQAAFNGGNPFSSSNSGSAEANPFASIGSPSSLAAVSPQRPVEEQPPAQSFAEKLKIGAETGSPSQQHHTEPWPSESAFPSPFTSFYLDAYPEELEKEATASVPAKAESSGSAYDIEDSKSTPSLDKDTFESALDKTFQKFSDRISQNPDQVLRYEFKGEPVLYSGNDDVASRFIVPHGKAGAPKGMPRCESCGAARVFEMQLVPGLIYEVEKDEEMSLDDGMEWGTIIVGTCEKNCGEAESVSFREEWSGVQWEERVARK